MRFSLDLAVFSSFSAAFSSFSQSIFSNKSIKENPDFREPKKKKNCYMIKIRIVENSFEKEYVSSMWKEQYVVCTLI